MRFGTDGSAEGGRHPAQSPGRTPHAYLSARDVAGNTSRETLTFTVVDTMFSAILSTDSTICRKSVELDLAGHPTSGLISRLIIRNMEEPPCSLSTTPPSHSHGTSVTPPEQPSLTAHTEHRSSSPTDCASDQATRRDSHSYARTTEPLPPLRNFHIHPIFIKSPLLHDTKNDLQNSLPRNP